MYAALYTTNPTAGDIGTEVVGGSYARQTLTFGAPSSGASSNSALASFSNMPATTVSYIGIRDALTTGNLLYFGPLTSAKTTNSGDTFVININDLQVSLS